MRRSPILLTVALASVLLAPVVSAQDTLSVTSTAAMGGVAANNCTGDGQPGPCGLDISHSGGNNAGAFVQDDTPTSESVYRGSYLFDNNSNGLSSSYSFITLRARGTNPNPGLGNCPAGAGALIDSFVIVTKGLANGTASVAARYKTNVCTPFGTPDLPIPFDGPVKICWEWASGTPGNGRIAIAQVSPANPCPPTGDLAWNSVANANNSVVRIDRTNMGVIRNHSANKHTAGFYFDEFESFRTLSP